MTIAAWQPTAARVLLPDGWPTRLHPDDLDLLDTPTPFLAMDLHTVQRRYAAIVNAFGGRVGVCYAVKCNPEPPVLTTLNGMGSGFEIASAPELELVLAAGADPSRVLYSNPVKPPKHVAQTYAAGVRRFAVDCLGEVAKIAAYAPGSEVFVRVRVDDTRSRFPLSAKFGAPLDAAAPLLLAAREQGLVPGGLTFHVGSQCADEQAWSRAVRSLATTLRELASYRVALPMLNIGGGFPARYGEDVPALQSIADATLEALDRLPHRPDEVVCEPGRSVVAEAGVLAATVIGRESRRGREWVYLDLGAYNGLMEAAQTGGRWRFPLRTSRDADPGAGSIEFTVTGPSCDSSDTLFYDAELPETLEVNDRVYIGSAGAYTLCYASSFNGFSPPVPVYID